MRERAKLSMEAWRLLIADGEEEFRRTLADLLSGVCRIRTAANGEEALRQLRDFSPDILILDLMMPGLDGITLLQRAADGGIHPTVLATTRFVSDYTIDQLQRLGVGYLMVKPCDMQAVVSRVADMAARLEAPTVTHPDARITASNLLLSLNVPARLSGYTYLREAILLMAKDPSQSLTKELYPAVAAIIRGNARQVEHAMRCAIRTAWEHRDERIWRMYFWPDGAGQLPRPTNAEFIARLADALNLNEQSALPE